MKKPASTPAVLFREADSVRRVDWTFEERLVHVRLLGRGVRGCVQMIREAGKTTGRPGERTDRAVAAFHQRLAYLEQQLSRIQDSLRLD